MKYAILALCFLLAACGGRSERDGSRLDGIRNSLTNAFTSAPEGGGLCGDPSLVGDVEGAVPGRLPACGIAKAVRLRAIGDVSLSQSALMDCATARVLKQWVDTSAVPTLKRQGGGLAELKVAAHYACRTRNHQPGAKISEHGKGKAIDISAFRLKDGSEITLIDDWGRGAAGRALRKMHKDACGPFGTVLGPDSDRFHKDHFHFDTAAHRGGSYCR